MVFFGFKGKRCNGISSVAPLVMTAAPQRRFLFTQAIKRDMEAVMWPLLHQEMIDYFGSKPRYSTDVHLKAFPRPSNYSDNYAYQDGFIPGFIVGFGRCRRIVVKESDIMPYAFDEADGHLSFHFKSRLYYLQLKNCVERVIVSDVVADTVERRLFQLQFHRYIPGYPQIIEVPVTLANAIGSAAFKRGTPHAFGPYCSEINLRGF